MSASQVIDLRKMPTWGLTEMLASSFHWSSDLPRVPLKDVALRLSPQTYVEAGVPTITPGGIDRQYGGIKRRSTRYQGGGYMVGGESQNLHPGDVLIPKVPGIPGIVVTKRLLGAVFSADFLAYRTVDDSRSIWLWGVLSSTTGHKLRRFLGSDGTGNLVTLLDDAALPWPPSDLQPALQESLQSLRAQVDEFEEDEAVSTWWSTADLRSEEWLLALASPNPDILNDGEPLSSYAAIIPARPVKNHLVQLTEEAGLLPVVNGRVLAGEVRPRWAARVPDVTVARPGDVLVAAQGIRANARVCERESIMGIGTYIVRPNDLEMAQRIAAYLNSQRGYAHRQMLLSGNLLGRLNASDLARMPLPEDVLSQESLRGFLLPIAEQLEVTLWDS